MTAGRSEENDTAKPTGQQTANPTAHPTSHALGSIGTGDPVAPATGARSVNESTVEEVVRHRLAQTLGGRRGVIEAAVPTAVFTTAWLATHHLTLSVGLSVGVALVLLAVRAAQRQTVQFVLSSLFGIVLAAIFALRSGRAEAAFLPGIAYNAVYAGIMLATVAARWPLVGFLVGTASGNPTGWRQDPAIVRMCSRLTLILALPCLLRVLVQLPLYYAGAVGWLGVSKIVLGWPLQVAALAGMLALLARGRTPLDLPPDDTVEILAHGHSAHGHSAHPGSTGPRNRSAEPD